MSATSRRHAYQTTLCCDGPLRSRVAGNGSEAEGRCQLKAL